MASNPPTPAAGKGSGAQEKKPEGPAEFLIAAPDETYGGVHPGLGVRFIAGVARTSDGDVTRKARELGMKVRRA